MASIRADFFDSLGKPYNPAMDNMQPVDYSQIRQPPAGTYTTMLNRENEHFSSQARPQLKSVHNKNQDAASKIMDEVELFRQNKNPTEPQQSVMQQINPQMPKYAAQNNYEVKNHNSLAQMRGFSPIMHLPLQRMPAQGPIQNDYQLQSMQRIQAPPLPQHNMVNQPGPESHRNPEKSVHFQQLERSRNRELVTHRQQNKTEAQTTMVSHDPSVFHNPHKELLIVTGQHNHEHHKMKQRMNPHPKQDHSMDIGSMKPIEIQRDKYYYISAENLPVEESRKVKFQKRLSQPNHYNQMSPQSKLQNTGAQVIVSNQSPSLYSQIGQSIMQRHSSIAEASYEFQNQGRLGQNSSNTYMKSRFYQRE